MDPPREKPTMLKVSEHHGKGEEEAAKRSCSASRRESCGAWGVEV